jgi:electron transfer flavoprotein alpha subunit
MSSDVFVVIEHLQGNVSDISHVMLTAARTLAGGSGGQTVAVLLGDGASGLASGLNADRVLYAEDPALAEFTSDAYQTVLAGLIAEHQPRAVLFGETSIGSDLAGGLSAKLGLPLVSSCFMFGAEGGALTFTSRTCGGKIMAEGEIPGPTALLSVMPGGVKAEEGGGATVETVAPADVGAGRVTLKGYLEPDTGDVDVTKEQVLIAVGRGVQAQDNIELADELAELLDGAVCASRPIVDQGWLPSSRLIGKSGKTVAPKLYLALGISGAPEHAEAITESEMIVAVNTDPDAPIFEVAKYGAEVDMLDLLEVLNEKVEEAKGA